MQLRHFRRTRSPLAGELLTGIERNCYTSLDSTWNMFLRSIERCCVALQIATTGLRTCLAILYYSKIIRMYDYIKLPISRSIVDRKRLPELPICFVDADQMARSVGVFIDRLRKTFAGTKSALAIG